MYYENKFGFYIKQYGIQITVGIICFIIAISGLFVYFKINNKFLTRKLKKFKTWQKDYC